MGGSGGSRQNNAYAALSVCDDCRYDDGRKSRQRYLLCNVPVRSIAFT